MGGSRTHAILGITPDGHVNDRILEHLGHKISESDLRRQILRRMEKHLGAKVVLPQAISKLQ